MGRTRIDLHERLAFRSPSKDRDFGLVKGSTCLKDDQVLLTELERRQVDVQRDESD